MVAIAIATYIKQCKPFFASADIMLNADEHPAIHNYLIMASDFLQGLWAEGYFD